jgi:outer membrane protein assembly factor BamD
MASEMFKLESHLTGNTMNISKKLLSNISMALLIVACGNSDVDFDEDLAERFEKGMQHYEAEKFKKAKEEFDFIVMNNPGSRLAVDSQYYLAESLFKTKKYIEATVAYEQYIRYSNDLEKIELSRYRICECVIKTSMIYQKDQKSTITALDKLQEFIEDFPESEYVDTASEEITNIRAKLATKLYQTARLYLKLEEYDSALIYYNQVLNNYYDTTLSDDARIGIMFTYILKDSQESAESYIRLNKENFHSQQKYDESLVILANTKEGKLTLNEYFLLYR